MVTSMSAETLDIFQHSARPTPERSYTLNFSRKSPRTGITKKICMEQNPVG
jgi:hypothetical protein